MSKIAYIGVSAIDQNTDRQKTALSEFNIDKYFVEKVSGKIQIVPNTILVM